MPNDMLFHKHPPTNEIVKPMLAFDVKKAYAVISSPFDVSESFLGPVTKPLSQDERVNNIRLCLIFLQLFAINTSENIDDNTIVGNTLGINLFTQKRRELLTTSCISFGWKITNPYNRIKNASKAIFLSADVIIITVIS